jgi:hypothetical protein
MSHVGAVHSDKELWNRGSRLVAAKETNLKGLLEGSKQYQVPLYQRVYSWEKEQWQRLWEDVVQLADDRLANPEATHFIGSLVLAPSPMYSPVGVAHAPPGCHS